MVSPDFESRSYQKSFEATRFFLEEVEEELKSLMRGIEVVSAERDAALERIWKLERELDWARQFVEISDPNEADYA